MGEVNLWGRWWRRFVAGIPTGRCALSTTTLTGYTLAKTRYRQHRVFYCPLDFSWAVKTALRRVRPSLLVLAELELWPNFVAAAHRAGVKVAIVNGRLSDRSFRGYRRLKPLRAANAGTDRPRGGAELAVRRSLLADWRASDSLYVTGSLKFDGARTIAQTR